MALICVPLVEKTIRKDVKLANSLDCDLVEVRLDYLKDASGLAEIGKIKKPVIATCMPKWEGGLFTGSEKERLQVLESCIPYSDYVTIELEAGARLRSELIKKARKRKVKVIVASHDFRKTPQKEEILRLIKAEKKAGADIAKVAFMAKKSEDTFTLISALAENKVKIPVIALSMGEKGRISRMLAPLFGSCITFAASSKAKASAPGQVTLDEIKRFRELW